MVSVKAIPSVITASFRAGPRFVSFLIYYYFPFFFNYLYLKAIPKWTWRRKKSKSKRRREIFEANRIWKFHCWSLEKMSWQTYVDDHLMCEIEGNHLTSAAIIGHDGSVWAQSSSFPQVIAVFDYGLLFIWFCFVNRNLIGSGLIMSVLSCFVLYRNFESQEARSETRIRIRCRVASSVVWFD